MDDGINRGNANAFNAAVRQAMESNSGFRWYIEQGLWAFGVRTPYEFVDRSRPYTLKDVVKQISQPVLVGKAEIDHFNPGQAERLAEALGSRATLRPFTAAESAGIHAHPGALVLMNGVVLDWLAETLEVLQPGESMYTTHGAA
ncbi:MAG TPA: hypothetical protein VFH67_05695 [bacterium]|nr:hypothetical protein [bacterium]